MKILSLLFLAASFASAEVVTQLSVDGTNLPTTVQGIPWIRITNYGGPSGNPDQGIGVSYRSEAMKIDLYVYDSLNSDWAKLPLKEKIQHENKSIPELFNQLTERGDYSNVVIKPSETLRVGNRTFIHTELSFTDKDAGDLNSHYYLAELNGRILKIRISCPLKSDPALVQKAFKEIAASVAGK
ncbi:hypothetical protein [Rariglobus hedericola]|uniref:DUF1795 domain-containing protein n=1 Tax=Rariglobus hedericola TaxID=2597822 RepID=A0A556QRI7_9BACT|nr:hypothetical protein [Rariglobus hedericola]TSJ79248.1 hypothetical protein FPL22_08135 [Rariglobus hedericola]